MRAADIKSFNYTDSLAQKRKRKFLFTSFLFILAVMVIVAGFVYAMFFNNLLFVDNVKLNDLKSEHTDQAASIINSALTQKTLGINISRNIIFFKSDNLKNKLLSTFPFLKDVSIDKEFPHSLIINFTERQTAGVWCNNSVCKFFDTEGNVWGDAVSSSGSLTLTVNDQRTKNSGDDFVDSRFLSPILSVNDFFKTFNPRLNKIVIPADSLNDFQVITSAGYPIIFSLDSNIGDQLKVLKIFLDNHKDPNFSPQYLDLRIDGRVYYK